QAVDFSVGLAQARASRREASVRRQILCSGFACSFSLKPGQARVSVESFVQSINGRFQILLGSLKSDFANSEVAPVGPMLPCFDSFCVRAAVAVEFLAMNQ